MITYRLVGKANRYSARFKPGDVVTSIFTTTHPMTLDEYKARCELFPNESINWVDVESWTEVPNA